MRPQNFGLTRLEGGLYLESAFLVNEVPQQLAHTGEVWDLEDVEARVVSEDEFLDRVTNDYC